MARHPDPGTPAIYEMAARWRTGCLDGHGSLLVPEARVWTPEVLDELEHCFVLSPDTGQGTFLEKLKQQLAEVSDTAVQLMAELHIVHFLVWWTIGSGGINASTKVAQLRTILSWRLGLPGLTREVIQSMEPGLAGMGQWALTRRDTQINYLIEFARAWKQLDAERRARINADPFELRAFSLEIDTPSSEGQRLAVLHLLEPDTFEPIMKDEHRKMIVARFRDLAGDEADLDKALLKIRVAPELQLGANGHFYREPVVHRWNKGKGWRLFLQWAREFRELPDFDTAERTYKLEAAENVAAAKAAFLAREPSWPAAMKTALGPPQNFVNFMVFLPMLGWIEEHPEEAVGLFGTLWESDEPPTRRIDAFAQRVPADWAKGPGNRINVASFLMLSDDPIGIPLYRASSVKLAWDLVGWQRPPNTPEGAVYQRFLDLCDELIHDSQSWAMPLRDRLDAQSVIWAVTKWGEEPTWPPEKWQKLLDFRSSAKRVKDDDLDDEDDQVPTEVTVDPAPGPEAPEEDERDWLAEAAARSHVDREEIDEIVELLRDKGQIVLYGPPGTGKTWVAQEVARALARGNPSRYELVQFHPSTSYEDFVEGLRPVLVGDTVSYDLVPGHLARIADAARKDPDRDYVLVIDEINRANLPKVFGELLFLLEYRDREIRPLYRPDETFTLPGNLLFIGTMNTADRSIALIDAAMRRRFHFKPFFPNEPPVEEMLERWLEAKGGDPRVATFFEAVNGELLQEVGEHLLIGPSHFMKKDLTPVRLERIWTYNIFPLLEELFWGQRDSITRWRWNAVCERHAALLGLVPVASAQPLLEPPVQPTEG